MNDSNRILRTSKEDLALDLVRNALRKQEFVRIRFTGNSMIPSIRNGDMIVIKKESPKSIKIGDIVIFDRENDLIGHRVIWKIYLENLYFLTRGDNIPFYDLPVHENAVYGKIIISNKNKNFVSKISLKIKLLFFFNIILLKFERIFSDSLRLIPKFYKKICNRIFQTNKGELSVQE